MNNRLCFGDSLKILREYVPDAPITLREPTKPMLTAADSAGFYELKEFPGQYPRLQILIIAELLAGRKLEYPAQRVETFAKAQRKWKSPRKEFFKGGQEDPRER